jgi:hypothetical protein
VRWRCSAAEEVYPTLLDKAGNTDLIPFPAAGATRPVSLLNQTHETIKSCESAGRICACLSSFDGVIG